MDTGDIDQEYIEEEHEDEDEDSYQKDDDEYLDMGILASGSTTSSAAPPLLQQADKISWKPEETNALIKKYKKHITQVKGFSDSSATFVSKIQMFGHIAAELSREFNCSITASQCQNRYKTMIRGHRRGFNKNMPKTNFEIVYTDPPTNKKKKQRSKSDDDNSEFNLVQNSLKVENNYDIEYSDTNNMVTNDDDENDDDDDDDDDYEPRQSKRPRKKKNVFDELDEPPPPPIPNSQTKQKPISGALLLRETMLEIYKMQEQNKDRRHQEWMDMWNTYLNTQKK